jgi:hypothetical protein
MGGTEIFRPMEWALKSFLKEKPYKKKPSKETGIMGPIINKFMQIKGKPTNK